MVYSLGQVLDFQERTQIVRLWEQGQVFLAELTGGQLSISLNQSWFFKWMKNKVFHEISVCNWLQIDIWFERMSTRSRPMSVNLDDSVFKIPGPNTPGRSKTGRTVSDSRMNTTANRSMRPPAGAGNFFSCDEEAGEMFSNSYLMDLKSGSCDVDSSDRISELARRNTLCPPHLKASNVC